MSELKQTMQRAREFIAANLAECCRDELDWQKSSILRDGKLREAAAIFGEVDKTHAIPMAQSETARQAMQLACRTQPEATKPAQDLSTAIPEGWQLVPKEPTKEILTQMAASCTCDQCLTRRYGWMLDAARLSVTPVVNPEVLKEQASVALIQRRKIQDLQKTVIELRSALAATTPPMTPTAIRFALSECQREQIKFAAKVLEVEGFNKEAEELQSIYVSTHKGCLASPADTLVAGDRVDARKAVFAAYSHCLANGDSMLPQEIADHLIAAIQAQKDGHG